MEIGATLSHYKITAKIGAGGMGEVYQAYDDRLDRDVAIKVLPADFSGDPARRERFEREARAVAALDHANIVPIHAIEEADGAAFMVMQLVEGRTLERLIAEGPLPVGTVFDVAVPVADALGAAHEAGVTHRDVKPGNIMVGTDRRVRILDFGLAKVGLAGPGQAGAPVTADSATRAVGGALTGEGQIVGTVAYMSPEQAEGRAIDGRSDIFSLGAVMYEMITGTQPFRGDTQISVITSILRDAPPSVTDVRRSLPRQLGRIVNRCLQKDPERRYQSAKDLRNDLQELKQEIESGVLDAAERGDEYPAAGRRARHLPVLAATAAVALGLGVVAGRYVLPWAGGGAGAAADSSAVAGATLTRLTFGVGAEGAASISPDGAWFVYTHYGREEGDRDADIFLQSVGGENPINLTANASDDDSEPAFSPDGNRIAFRSSRDGGGIYVMGRTGESPRRLANFGYNPSWSPDGARIVVSRAQTIDVTPYARARLAGLSLIDVQTGAVTELINNDAVEPSWSPDGEHIVFWGLSGGSGQRDIYMVAVSDGSVQRLSDDPATDWTPVFSPDGAWIYYSSDRAGTMNLWRIPVDRGTGGAAGEPQQVTVGGTAGASHPRFSADGRRMLYREATITTRAESWPFDPVAGRITGSPTLLSPGSRNVDDPELSPDGQWLAYRTSDGQQEDIFVQRVDGDEVSRLTNDVAKDRGPTWFPDGQRLAFYSDRGGSYEAWEIRTDGSGLQQLTRSESYSGLVDLTLSPDGTKIAASGQTLEEGRWAVLVFDITGTLPASPDLEVPYESASVELWPGSWSADGSEVAVSAGDELLILDLEAKALRSVASLPADDMVEPLGLTGARQFVVLNGQSVWLLDLTTGESRPLFSIAPDRLANFPSLTRDDRQILIPRQSLDGDIWMLDRPER